MTYIKYSCEKIETIDCESIIKIKIEPCQTRHSSTEIDSVGTKTQSCQTQNQSNDATQIQPKLQCEPPSNMGPLPIYHFSPIYLPNPSPPCIPNYLHHHHSCENYWNICPTPRSHYCDQCCFKACCELESSTKPAKNLCEKKNVSESAKCKSWSSKEKNSVEKKSDCEQIAKDDTQYSSVTICTSQEENRDVSEHQSKKAHKSKNKKIPKKKPEKKVHHKVPQKTFKSEKKFQADSSCRYEFSIMFSPMLTDAFCLGDIGVNFKFRTDGKLFNLRKLQTKTKVQKDIAHDFLFDDDFALNAGTQSIMQKNLNRFAKACDNFGLTISIKKTEVMYQPAPKAPYTEPVIPVNGEKLTVAKKFIYFGSTLSYSVSIDRGFLQNRKSQLSFRHSKKEGVGKKRAQPFDQAESVPCNHSSYITICMRNIDCV